MSERLCEFEGCDRKEHARTYCDGHYRQLLEGRELAPIVRNRNRKCTFPGCLKKHRGHGLCDGHLSQRRSGQELKPLRSKASKDMTLEERLWSRVDRDGPEGCWLWTGAKVSAGYGNLVYEAKSLCTHRIAWELIRGPIPEGRDLDHLCHNPACCNPDHLRVVDRSANCYNRRSWGKSGIRGVRQTRSLRWEAKVKRYGKDHYLGTYDTPEEASAVVKAFYKEHGVIIDSRSELLGLEPTKI